MRSDARIPGVVCGGFFRFTVVAGLVLTGSATFASEPTRASALDLSKYFGDVDACMVWLEKESGVTSRYRSQRCSARHAPCSTFKIPNALIGLETGVVRDGAHVFPWDGEVRGREALNRDHDLSSAIRNSVVWYFQRLASGVGEVRMREFLARIGYGNEDMSGGLTRFWLRSSLRISADEHVRFLERLLDDELPFSKRNHAIVKEALVLERSAAGVFCGKTGSGRATDDEADLGWFIGWVRTGDRTVVFAANALGENAWGWEVEKKVRSILADRGVWPVNDAGGVRSGRSGGGSENSGSGVGMPKEAADDSSDRRSDTAMLKSAMEIHEAILESRSVSKNGDVVLVLSAYVHQSTGEPGVEAGSVTRERLEIRVASGKLDGEMPHLPVRIEEGQGECGGESYVNLLRVPVQKSEPFELELLALTGEEFRVTGPTASVRFLSRPAFIDLEAPH